MIQMRWSQRQTTKRSYSWEKTITPLRQRYPSPCSRLAIQQTTNNKSSLATIALSFSQYPLGSQRGWRRAPSGQPPSQRTKHLPLRPRIQHFSPLHLLPQGPVQHTRLHRRKILQHHRQTWIDNSSPADKPLILLLVLVQYRRPRSHYRRDRRRGS